MRMPEKSQELVATMQSTDKYFELIVCNSTIMSHMCGNLKKGRWRKSCDLDQQMGECSKQVDSNLSNGQQRFLRQVRNCQMI